jgi:hypothetical protein
MSSLQRSTSDTTVLSVASSNEKLLKEKEELRRINRAWNAKAEEEKRKVMFSIILFVFKLLK